MATNMTKNELEIREASGGFASGKLYEGSTAKEIKCISIFDKGSCNFHLCPDDYEMTCSISEEIGKKRLAVLGALEELSDSGGIKALDTKGEFKDEIKKQETKSDNIIYISGKSNDKGGAGQRGNIKDREEFGHLFHFISASKNGIKYELNFMRFFVDNTNEYNNVDCILKAIQFDRCIGESVNHDQSVEGGCDICYPHCFCSQTDDELECMLKRREGKSFCFNPRLDFNDDAMAIAKEFIRFINISDAFGRSYIVKKEILNKSADNKYFLKLNRASHCLEIYEKKDMNSLRSDYPIRQDYNLSDYMLYALKKTMVCVFGGSGHQRTPCGIFNIEEVSKAEYVSPYHPNHDKVKFFGYLVVFEDYFIHSDMYLMDVGIDSFRLKEPISVRDKHTSGCIRVKQEDLDWLVGNISIGTTIEM